MVAMQLLKAIVALLSLGEIKLFVGSIALEQFCEGVMPLGLNHRGIYLHAAHLL